MKEILTTYLTKKGDPQRQQDAAKPNDPEKMKLWYPALDCGVVFHDELNGEFIRQFPRATFIKVKEYPYSCNDGRFYLFRKYLIDNPGVDEVWITDLFDVKVNYLPRIQKGRLYASNEGQNWHLRTNWMLHKHKLFDTGILQGKKVYNAGVFGGHRNVILPILDEMIKQFSKMRVGNKNGNMVVFNKIVHSLKIPIVTGYPLHTQFKKYQQDDHAAFQHK